MRKEHQGVLTTSSEWTLKLKVVDLDHGQTANNPGEEFTVSTSSSNAVSQFIISEIGRLQRGLVVAKERRKSHGRLRSTRETRDIKKQKVSQINHALQVLRGRSDETLSVIKKDGLFIGFQITSPDN